MEESSGWQFVFEINWPLTINKVNFLDCMILSWTFFFWFHFSNFWQTFHSFSINFFISFVLIKFYNHLLIEFYLLEWDGKFLNSAIAENHIEIWSESQVWNPDLKNRSRSENEKLVNEKLNTMFTLKSPGPGFFEGTIPLDCTYFFGKENRLVKVLLNRFQ